MTDLLTYLSDLAWGPPTVALILGAGIYLSGALGLPQISRLRDIFGSVRHSGAPQKLSISTALAATVGTGSVVGVASAIKFGGPGAVFWLWVSAFFGMAVSYAEGVLSVKYRRECPRSGGFWYVLRDGAGLKFTAILYALFTAAASFGMGCMAQISSASAALKSGFSFDPVLVGAICSAMLLACLFIDGFAGKLCSVWMPFFTGFYILGSLAVILKNISSLPGVVNGILAGAFGFRPIVSGTAGYGIARAVSVGVRRGVFSNEAGLGTTAPIHAVSGSDDPDRQGLMNMFEVSVDTFLICTLTALAVLCSGADTKNISDGAGMVLYAAGSVFGEAAGKLVALCIAAFSVATAVGWSQIGLSAAEYLMPKSKNIYKIIYSLCAILGAALSLESVLKLSDIFNGLMAIPCTAAIIMLRKEIIKTGAKRPD